MASELRVNTLKDAAGANSVAMEYVAGGSAKVWANFNGDASPATLRDSFSISSLDDNGTGSYGLNFSASMDSVNYSWANGGTNSGHSAGWHLYESSIFTGSISVIGLAIAGGNTAYDSGQCFAAIHGDLA